MGKHGGIDMGKLPPPPPLAQSIFVNLVYIRSNFATVEKMLRRGCTQRNCYRVLIQIPQCFVATRSSFSLDEA